MNLNVAVASAGALAPVAVVAGQRHLVALDPFAEAERTGADRRGRGRLDALGRDDHRVAPGHVEREIAVGLRQRDLHRSPDRPLRRWRYRRTVPSGHWSSLSARAPVEAEHHVLGVKRRAVVEGDALREGEGVDGAVLAHLPSRRQCRQHRAVRSEPREPLEDIGIDHLVDRRGGAAGGVEVGRLEHHADGDRVLLGKSGAGGERQRGGEGELFHGRPSCRSSGRCSGGCPIRTRKPGVGQGFSPLSGRSPGAGAGAPPDGGAFDGVRLGGLRRLRRRACVGRGGGLRPPGSPCAKGARPWVARVRQGQRVSARSSSATSATPARAVHRQTRRPFPRRRGCRRGPGRWCVRETAATSRG